MARFPKAEAGIASLAQSMISGLTGSNGLSPVFPAPPVPVADLTTLLTAYTTARNAAIAAESAVAQAVVGKDAALADLIEGMKSNLRYAENTVNYDDELLKLLGWGGRRPATPLQPPGQTRLLLATEQGEGWVKLTWKAPVDGGKPSAYRTMRRERPEGPWSDVGTAVVCEATLLDQPRSKEYEYRIIAVNKAGDGEPSNTVVVVL